MRPFQVTGQNDLCPECGHTYPNISYFGDVSKYIDSKNYMLFIIAGLCYTILHNECDLLYA